MPLFTPPPLPWYLAHEANASTIDGGNGALTTNLTYLVGVLLPAPAIVVNMRTRLGAVAAGHLDMGIYDSSGNLLDHTGVISPAGTGIVTTHALSNGNLALPAGRYYLALWIDNNTDTYYRNSVGAANTAWGNFLTGVNPNGTGSTNTTTGLLANFAAMGGTTTTNALHVCLMALLSGGMA